MTATSSRLQAAALASAAALAALLGVATAFSPKLGGALVGAAVFIGLAMLGFTAILAGWMIAFFIPFYSFGNVLLKAGLVLATAAAVFAVARRHETIALRVREAAPFFAAALLFLAWLAASVLWAHASGTAFSELWKYGISIGIFLAITSLVDSRRAVQVVAVAFVVGALVTAIGGLLGFQGGVINSLPSEGRLQGGCGDPNVLAAAVIAAGALAAGLLKGTRQPPLRICLMVAIIVFGLTAAGTGSRGGTVAALAALIAALAVMRDSRRTVWGVAVVIAASGVAWLALSGAGLGRLTDFGGEGDGRDDLWRIAWEMFLRHPLQGVGLQNFITTAPDYVLHPGGLTFIHLITERPVVTHNTYLQFLAESGVVGLMLFLILVAVSLAASLRAAHLYEAGGDPVFATLARCVFVAAIALLAASFFISAGVDYKIWAILGLGPAMLLNARRGPGAATAVSKSQGASSSVGGSGDPVPRVAVIVPCYNDGATLVATLASLGDQEPCELIVIDDGSDDAVTLGVLGQLRGEGVRVLSQPNRGLSAARMLGVESTSAPFIQPLDADDFLPAGALEALADALEADPDLGVAWGDQQTFGELEFVQRRTDELDPWAITYVNRLTAGLIRREALLGAGGWVLEIGYEDWDLWMGLAENGWRGRRIDRVTYLYRISSTRMLSGARSHHEDLYAQMRARHPRLFAARRHNWRRSRSALGPRLLLPVIDRLPLSQLSRHRLGLAVCEPAHALKVRRARHRARR